MTQYNCMKHGIYYPVSYESTAVQCPRCANEAQAAVPPLRAEPFPTPISQEERAVIEEVIEIRQRSGNMYENYPSFGKLWSAVDALQASRRPKDYAPEELEPGQRFTFVDDAGNSPAIRMVYRPEGGGLLRGYRWENEEAFCQFRPSDRLIPIPDQD